MIKHLLSLIIILSLPIILISQPSVDFKKYSEKYKGKKAVCLRKSEDAVIEIIKKKPVISINVYNETLLLTKNVTQFSENYIDFSDMRVISKFDAKTLAPINDKYKAIKVDNVVVQNSEESGVFFDDGKIIRFSFPALEMGAKTVFSYKETIIEPRFYGSFYFSKYVPVEESKYSITVPENVKIRYKLFNTDSINVEYFTEQTGKKIKHTWIAKNVEAADIEDYSPGIRYTVPHMIVAIEQYESNGEIIKINSNPEDFVKWNNKLREKAINEDNENLKSFVDSLVGGLESELEKVKAIFRWTQSNIKYIAFEDGMNGYIPRSAISVFEKRYGDCKDMSNLMHEMSKIAGVKNCNCALIGTRNIPYKFLDVCSPMAVNHMIAIYEEGDDAYILDATSRYSPFGRAGDHLQDKEALILLDDNKYKIITIPIITHEYNQKNDSLVFTIENNKIVGSGQTHLKGYYSSDFRYVYNPLSEKNKKKFMRAYLEKGNDKFIADTFSIVGLNDLEDDIKINYAFNVDDYVRFYEDEVFINLNLTKPYSGYVIDLEKRKSPYENSYKSSLRNYLKLVVPDNYRIENIPEHASFNDELFGFELTYLKVDDGIVLITDIYMNKLMTYKNKFEVYNKMVRALTSKYSEAIILKKISNE